MPTTFTDLGVPAELTDTLARGGVTTPFPVQAATIADALAGRDLCARAPTGSGKTLAFAVPLAARTPRGTARRPRALVLTPTRELAAQIAAEMRPLTETAGRSVATFYGGTGLGADQRRLRRGVDVAVACPGRLADLVRRGDADLSQVELVVVDEADRMADMGFLPEVRRLLDQTAAQRQTLLFSATLDGDVDVLVRGYQRDPVRHELGGTEESTGDVRHFFWHAPQPADRTAATRQVLQTVEPAIVFTRTKHGADRLAKQLTKQGVAAAAIHGNRSQNQRERALADLSHGRISALIATDVAARGIHVDHVEVVVHYDPPATGKDYTHRSGRTGRAGSDGLVVTLVAPDKVGDVKGLQRSLAMRPHVDSVAVEQLTGRGGARPGDAPAADGRGGGAARSGDAGGSGKGSAGGQNRRGGKQRGDKQRRGQGGSGKSGGKGGGGKSGGAKSGGAKSGGGPQPAVRTR